MSTVHHRDWEIAIPAGRIVHVRSETCLLSDGGLYNRMALPDL